MLLRTLLYLILHLALFALGLLSVFITVDKTFDGYQLMLAAAALGCLFYMLMFRRTKQRGIRLSFKERKRVPSKEFKKLTLCLCVFIFFTACVNVMSGLDNRSSIQAQVTDKERKRLRSSGYLHYIHVDSNDYGHRKIWVRKKIYEKVDVGGSITVHLTTSIFGYNVVRRTELVSL